MSIEIMTAKKHFIFSMFFGLAIYTLVEFLVIKPVSKYELLQSMRSILGFLFVYSMGLYLVLKSKGFFEKDNYGNIKKIPYPIKLQLSIEQIAERLEKSS